MTKRSNLEHYVALVDGLLAHRAAFGDLSDQVEAPLSGLHSAFWLGRLTEQERVLLDGEDGLIEQLKRKWAPGEPPQPLRWEWSQELTEGHCLARLDVETCVKSSLLGGRHVCVVARRGAFCGDRIYSWSVECTHGSRQASGSTTSFELAAKIGVMVATTLPPAKCAEEVEIQEVPA